MTGISGDLSRVRFIITLKQYCGKKINSFTVIPSKTAKSSYFFPSYLSTFPLLVQLLLPTVKLNRTDQPISIEYKINKTVSGT